MPHYKITKGRNIKIKGAAKKELVDFPLPQRVAIHPPDFKGLKPRLAVKEGDEVKVGTPLVTDKAIEGVCVVSPASGKVAAVNRGEKRVLLDIIVETDGKQESEIFEQFRTDELSSLDRKQVISNLLKAGLWPVIRQRPFSKIAQPDDQPKSIFVHAMNTEPMALDIDFILNEREDEFQAGLNIIKRLTDKDVHLCVDNHSTSKALNDSQNVVIQRFSGVQPTGNVSTHIHYVDPIGKGDIVWYIEAQDVLRIAHLFLKATYPTERIVAITGEGAKNRAYAKTIVGAPLTQLLKGSDLSQVRCITGSVLSGRTIGQNGFLGFYDSQITAIPEGGKREFLGWLMPGFNKYTFSKSYASAFLPEREYSIDTDEKGGHRAIVLNHLYDSLNTLDIYPYFLIKAVLAGDIEEAEKLGILECDEEDFALCTFACPSKFDVGGVIKDGLELIEKEG